MIAALCAAELLVLEGPDAATFAHSQFCNDVKSLPVDTWQWNAWLDPHGRVRCFFALLHVKSQQFVAWLPLGGAMPMRAALGRYVMRAAVEIDVVTWTLHALGTTSLPTALTPEHLIMHNNGYVFAQPSGHNRHAWIAPSPGGPFNPEALNQWRLADIDAGLPLLSVDLGGEFVAQALDLEQLAAIRFDKGCYPGQEIAARLHFRGGNKRHLRHVRVHGEAPLPGDEITDAKQVAVGRFLYSAKNADQENNALAVLENISDDVLLFTKKGSHVFLYT